jgi:hypothetical protein
MDQETALVSLGAALGVGLLIGFEREQSAGAEREGGPSLGGVRTYPLVSLGGALSTMLAREVGAWFVAVAFAAVAALVAVSYAGDVRNGRDRGMTSEVAMLATFVLGALAPGGRRSRRRATTISSSSRRPSSSRSSSRRSPRSTPSPARPRRTTSTRR